ncbi:hypothetical protein RCK87_25790, partial [Salmonella enterica subsp. enterica serovar 1,4,[5],12:i:-]
RAMKIISRLATAGVVFVITSAAKAADANQESECGAPCVEYSGYAELNSDWYFPTESSTDNSVNIHPKSEVEVKVTPFDSFSVLTSIVTE